MDGPRYISPENAQAQLAKDQARQNRDAQRSTGTERNLTLQEVQAALAAAQEALAQVIAVQNAQAQQLAILNSTRPVGASGGTGYNSVAANTWTTVDQPQVSFITATGVARIDVQAMILATGSGTCIATFGLYRQSDGAVLMNRDSLRDSWKGFSNGVLGGMGGSSFLIVPGLPVNTPIVARFECYAFDQTAMFRSPSISAAGTA